MLLGSAEEAASYDASTFMIYTGAPQNTRRKAIEDMRIDEGQSYMAEHGLSNIVVHAPYIVNLGNPNKKKKPLSLLCNFYEMKSNEQMH